MVKEFCFSKELQVIWSQILNDSLLLQTCFKPIPEEVIEQLVEEGEIFQCAGGLMIEHPLITPLILSMAGSEDAIQGLCKDTVLNTLLRVSGLEFEEEDPEIYGSDHDD